MPYENKPESNPLPQESVDKIDLINKTLKTLENTLKDISNFHLETENGREGIRLALNLVFSYIEKIEGEDEYEIVGLIKERICETYTQSYIKSSSDGTPQYALKRVAFYGEI